MVVSGTKFKNVWLGTVLSADTTNYTLENNSSESVDGETAASQTFIESRGAKKTSSTLTKTIAQNTTGTFTEVDFLDDYNHITIEYVCTVGTNKKIGKFRAVGTGSAYNFEDDFISTADLNVEFEVNTTTGVITYNTTGATGDATLTYSIEFHA